MFVRVISKDDPNYLATEINEPLFPLPKIVRIHYSTVYDYHKGRIVYSALVEYEDE